jgi:hypothetical protein
MPTPKVNSWLGWRIFTVNTTQEHARLNEMAFLRQDNIALREELIKCRDHVYQLLRQENDQMKEI